MQNELYVEIADVIKEHHVRHIQLWFTDILGNLKMVEVPTRRLEGVMQHGVPFDGSSITGYAEVEESDIVAMPDWNTFKLLSWSTNGAKAAFVFCDILDHNLTPFEGDPRWVLRRQQERARAMGFEFFVGPEIEYFYFKTAERPEAIDEGGYFDVLPDDLGNNLRTQTMTELDDLGIPMETSHHEVAPSQHEIDPRYGEALVMADRVMITRLVVKEVAARNGVHATFMSKPLPRQAASAFHVHQSLFHGDANAFYSESDPDHLSDIARGFIAGQLMHIREITSILNPDINSYKRLVPGFEAPVYVSWGHRNRTALIRVPLYTRGMESSVRAELRSPGSSANPYLAFAVMLSAGLEGIERGYELPLPVEPNIYKMGADKRNAIGLERLPNNLYEAITATSESELVRSTLGSHIFERYITNKLNEWSDYREHISDFEIGRYFSRL